MNADHIRQQAARHGDGFPHQIAIADGSQTTVDRGRRHLGRRLGAKQGFYDVTVTRTSSASADRGVGSRSFRLKQANDAIEVVGVGELDRQASLA